VEDSGFAYGYEAFPVSFPVSYVQQFPVKEYVIPFQFHPLATAQAATVVDREHCPVAQGEQGIQAALSRGFRCGVVVACPVELEYFRFGEYDRDALFPFFPAYVPAGAA